MMARKNKKSSKNAGLDLNGDGVFDSKDKSIAAKVLASKIMPEEVDDEEPVEPVIPEEEDEGDGERVRPDHPEVEEDEDDEDEAKAGDRIAKVDINLAYRKGDVVPASQIAVWERIGLNISDFF